MQEVNFQYLCATPSITKALKLHPVDTSQVNPGLEDIYNLILALKISMSYLDVHSVLFIIILIERNRVCSGETPYGRSGEIPFSIISIFPPKLVLAIDGSSCRSGLR